MDPISAVGLGVNVIGGIIQSREAAKRRKQAMRFLREMIAEQRKDFATAKTSLDAGRERYLGDPRRAQINSRWQERLANPNVISPEMESILRHATLDQTAREAGDGTSQTRESLQRRGLGGSALGAGVEAANASAAAGRASAINNDLRVKVEQTNRTARDNLYREHEDYVGEDLRTMYGFDRDTASLYGSKSYGNSALLAGV